MQSSDEDVDDPFDYGDLDRPAPPPDPQSDAGQRLGKLVNQLANAQKHVKQCESELETAKGIVRDLEEQIIPKVMAELGAVAFTNSAGIPIKIKKEVHASLPKKDLVRRHAGLKWLVDNDYGSIIKYEATIEIAKGDGQTVKALAAHLEAFDRRSKLKGVAYSEDVHPQTLAAAIREMEKAGVDVPMDILGAHSRRVAKIEKAKGSGDDE